MRHSETVQQALAFLLGLTDDDTAARIRARVGLPGPDRPEAARLRIDRVRSWPRLPASVVLWILEQDDPALNAAVCNHLRTDSGLRRAVARGMPFGPGRTAPVPVDPRRLPVEEPEIPESYVRLGLVGALRAAGTMAAARGAASMVLSREDWAAASAADEERPLPGYARWALSVRPDCPPPLRARFGSHPKFTHRVRQAGVLDGPAEYATAHRPAARVLEVLALGRLMFPARVGDAEDALRPLVHDRLGGREEAWAVLAQIAGTFHGTAPDLVRTAGAIA